MACSFNLQDEDGKTERAEESKEVTRGGEEGRPTDGEVEGGKERWIGGERRRYADCFISTIR